MATAIENVRREVKILKTLAGYVKKERFRIEYFQGGKYTMEDAKTVMIQILNVVAFCHLQGVVHRELKHEIQSQRNAPLTFTSGTSSHRNLKMAALALTSRLPSYALLILNNKKLEALSKGKDRSHVMQVGISNEGMILDSLV
ncbi:hypothetical protein F2Q68_00035851 [Brassica cretica]|uniref:Protein kinase domain-containing protein n=2 Tax=Brassica cretica TaxID=69181 RepID=A0ABQ7EIQ2_BRACR|nr:hypothetical protein F2Q68_00035851 [Brassica cretica]KAF3596662.1 hypothetical protein DY000_02024642 [Brassica cretica]